MMSNISSHTSHLNTFHPDFTLAIPRFLSAAGSFAFVTVPERIDSILHGGGSMIAEATGNGSRQMMSAHLSGGVATAQASNTTVTAASGAGAGPAVPGAPTNFGSFTFQQIRNFGGLFMYMTSKWALACFALVIVLNRTQIYASARRHITLSWPLRLTLRLIPIMMFLSHTLSLLQAMRCQTSPYYSVLKYGSTEKQNQLDFSGEGGILYYLSSKLLFMESDADSCLAVDMIPSPFGEWDPRGSLSLLWPLFQALCLGQFVETLSCAVQGRSLMTETGMSIFEHSLAFAEAEGMLSNTLGLSSLGIPKSNANPSKAADAGEAVFTRRSLVYQLNTPPESLLMGLISSLNNLSSQILGVFDKQAKFRLINTGVWGLCFMGAFVWGFFSVRPESGPGNIILRFPTVCIVGFIPHLLILIGIMICGMIYSLALMLCLLSPPDDIEPQTFMERCKWARENMQANAQLSNIRLDMHEDFYTALLKIGFTALTVASEAVYLNEWKKIGVARFTWLEEDRMKEIEAFEKSNDPAQRLSAYIDNTKEIEDIRRGKPWKSGYARQQTVKAVKALPHAHHRRVGADGVGHLQRGGRYLVAYEFFQGIFWLFIGWLKLLTNKSLDKIGITRRPEWLRPSKSREGVKEAQKAQTSSQRSESLDFWILSDDGILSLPEDDNVDVEQETKRRMQFAKDNQESPSEEQLSSNLYEWWKHGGWWGEKDESGSYAASVQDNEDTTSVISMSTNASEADGDADAMDIASRRSTPTQRHPYPQISRSPTPITDHALDPAHLASLLDPKDASSRQEARMLAHHLAAPKIITRSQYRHAQSFANTKLLTSTRYRPEGSNIASSGPLSPEEEAQLLEHLILSRRSQPPTATSTTASSFTTNPAHNQNPPSDAWRQGAPGFGSSGPQCVVCQSAPRTVLAWPCRCLSLCEDCRDVVGFSRLFVP
ncbi:MAG: hypothetical protein Q9217_004462 [Psora testacea]